MRVADHIVHARREKLASLLQQHQYLPIGEVCVRLGVSEPTARRDLAALEQRHAITRTHGGALAEYNQRFPSFRDRTADGAEAKRRIGVAARRILRPGQVVWLDGGTTLFAVAQAIADDPIPDLTIVTNNLPAADLLGDSDKVAVYLLGGRYLRRSSVLLGGNAIADVKAWTFDCALLGAEGLTPEGFWNTVPDVVALQRAVMARAACRVVCLDAAKVGRSAPAPLGPVEEFSRILTDAGSDLFRAAGIRLPRGCLMAAAAAT